MNVHIPRDKVTTVHSGFGFVEFRSEEDAEYAIKIMNMIKLHGQVGRFDACCWLTMLRSRCD